MNVHDISAAELRAIAVAKHVATYKRLCECPDDADVRERQGHAGEFTCICDALIVARPEAAK